MVLPRLGKHGRASDGADLLLSILLRFPEVASITFKPSGNILEFIFLIAGVSQEENPEQVKVFLINSINAYHQLEGWLPAHVKIDINFHEQAAFVTIARDAGTLSQGELSLIIALLKDRYGASLVVDGNTMAPEGEDIFAQDEAIDDMLEDLKSQFPCKGLVGFREDGRVFVYNK